MKALLVSIKPKWCAKIMNGDKTIEVRKGTALYKAIKKHIDQYGYADIYVYCTKGKDLLLQMDFVDEDNINAKLEKDCDSEDLENSCNVLNGKVIFKFRCYKVEEIFLNRNHFVNEQYSTDELDYGELLDKSCLTYRELDNYLQCEIGCAIHISDLEIFDKPKELSEFGVKHSPQSWCYVEVE